MLWTRNVLSNVLPARIHRNAKFRVDAMNTFILHNHLYRLLVKLWQSTCTFRNQLFRLKCFVCTLNDTTQLCKYSKVWTPYLYTRVFYILSRGTTWWQSFGLSHAVYYRRHVLVARMYMSRVRGGAQDHNTHQKRSFEWFIALSDSQGARSVTAELF